MRNWIPRLVAGLLLAASPALASDWAGWAELETIEVLTVKAGGEATETTIWIVVLEGTAYIRTNESSPWGDAVETAQTIGLRGGGEERTVRPTAITEDAQRERVIAEFRRKYGFFDGLLDFARGHARIWSLEVVTS